MPNKRAACNLSPLSSVIPLKIVCFSSSAIGIILPCPLLFPLPLHGSGRGKLAISRGRSVVWISGTAGEGIRPFQTILQLADVPRPIVGHDGLEGFVA